MKVIDKKLKKVMEMKTDSPQMIEAIGALSSFYGRDGNTIEARRSLRSQLETRNLSIAKDFLSTFEVTFNQLKAIESSVTHLRERYGDICTRIHDTELATADILQQTKNLMDER